MKCFSMVMSDILKFSVGRAGSEDYIAWNYTKNGVFSVKSAYHLKNELGMNQAGRAGPSISTDDHRGWLNLWAADVPGKVNIHLWRLINNGLAVGDELHRRNIKHGSGVLLVTEMNLCCTDFGGVRIPCRLGRMSCL
jgi:hypothetical protein